MPNLVSCIKGNPSSVKQVAIWDLDYCKRVYKRDRGVIGYAGAYPESCSVSVGKTTLARENNKSV